MRKVTERKAEAALDSLVGEHGHWLKVKLRLAFALGRICNLDGGVGAVNNEAVRVAYELIDSIGKEP